MPHRTLSLQTEIDPGVVISKNQQVLAAEVKPLKVKTVEIDIPTDHAEVLGASKDSAKHRASKYAQIHRDRSVCE